MWMRITYIVVSGNSRHGGKAKKVLKNAVVCPEYWYGNRSGNRFFSSNSKYLYYLDKNYHLKRYDKRTGSVKGYGKRSTISRILM